MCEFTIIVPVFNEAGNINRLEKALLDYIKISPKTTAILFVDDGSTDKSLDSIQAVCKRHDPFHFIAFSENKGLSTVLKAGFDYTQSPLVGYIDSDLQTNPEDFNLLLSEIGDHDLVTGARTNRKDSFKKNLSSKVANRIRRCFTKDGMDDTGCPLKIIKTEYAKRIPMFKGLHRFLPAMILLQNGKIKQVPVRHYPRRAGKAKYFLSNRLTGPFLDCFIYLWIRRKYINYTIAFKDE